MFKIKLLFLCAASVFFPAISFAQEQITITTYYPSPAGSYNELTANSMKIGSTYSGAGTPFVNNGLIVEGKVGIGTTNPLSELHVNDLGNINEGGGIIIERASPGFNGSPRLQMVDTDLGPVATTPSWAIDNFGDRFRIFRQPNISTTGLEFVTVLNSGNVGIGTTDPQSELHIRDSGTQGRGILIERSNPGSPRVGMIDTDLGSATTAPVWFIDNNNDVFRIFRQPNIDTPGASFVNVLSNGNVGIGTTTAPSAKLQVEGTAVISGNVGIGTTNPLDKLAVQGTLYAKDTIKGDNGLIINGPVSMSSTLNVSAATRLNGNVGIGKAPTVALDVAGIIQADTLGTLAGTTLCRNTNNRLSICSSSRKGKDNISYLKSSEEEKILKDITDTKIARFRMKEDKYNNIMRVGIIAEESPKDLRFIDEHGNPNIDFLSAQLGYTWAAIKVLDRRIEELQKENQELKAKLSAFSKK